MIVLGIDAHKRTHTVVAVDQLGRELGCRTTTATNTADHLALVRWADQFGAIRSWAVEDCRHLACRLERDMLAAGERIVRVPPKLMAHARDSARTFGKSDPIDALAIARAALREPNLPVAHLEDTARELRVLVDHREDPRCRTDQAYQSFALAPPRYRSELGTRPAILDHVLNVTRFLGHGVMTDSCV